MSVPDRGSSVSDQPGPNPVPAEDRPCCPTCGGRVDELTLGIHAGSWLCVDRGGECWTEYFAFGDLAWSA